jgi:hypothetical protein
MRPSTLLRLPQYVPDDPVGSGGSLASGYHVRSAEVDALVNAYLHDIASHVRKTLIRSGRVGGRAEHREGRRVTEDVLERARHRTRQVFAPDV